jgi:CRISPR/Cas system CSM-associated protein Csm3 (group 7 of RAMP superfamily)
MSPDSGTQRLDIRYLLRWQAGWHVGSGLGSAGIDRLVRRRACGLRGRRLPYVPGSQIKGVLRHHCERLAELLRCPVVSPHILGEAPQEVVENFRPLIHSKLIIDRLFGSRCQGECLYVEDAVPPEDAKTATRVHGRTAIDRVSGTARAQTLFVTEVVADQQIALAGRIRARHQAGVLTRDENGFPYEYALLVAGLLSIEALGGNKSAGLGGCRVELADGGVVWNGNPLSAADALTGFQETEWRDMLELLREGGGA